MERELALGNVTTESVEVVDSILDGWALRLEAVEAQPARAEATSPMALLLTSEILNRFPQAQGLLGRGGALKVVFSPAVRKGIATGRYHLLDTSAGAMPTAVSGAGRIVEHARVAPEVLGGVGAGAAIGAGVAISWPIVLAGAAAVAAAYAHQRWTEQTFTGLKEALSRVEARLRDDDLGALDAADALVEWVRPDVASGVLARVMEIDLAIAKRDVDAIYFSRRRFVERFKRDLEQRQVEHERRKGERQAWVDDLAKELADSRRGVMDELVVFVRAMITRSRLASCEAILLSQEGAPGSAIRLVDMLESTTRSDYHDLHNRLRALSRAGPDQAIWRRLPGLSSSDAERAREGVKWLAEQMGQTIGSALPPADGVLEITVNPDELGSVLEASR